MAAGTTSVRKLATSSWSLRQCLLTIDNVNQNLRPMKYVGREPLYQQAREIERELLEGKKKTFKKVLLASHEDCQAMGQPPITFVRQVLACLSYTPLLDNPEFPADVKERVRFLLSGCRGDSVGSYADSGGIEIVRQDCAKYIENRDGFPSNWNEITLTGGASEGIRAVLNLLKKTENGKKAAILTPIPNYPFYSSITTAMGMGEVGYHLDEDNAWDLTEEELKRAINEGRKNYNIRGIVIINPGNPAGQVFPIETIERVIRFAFEENLYILADEVHLENVFFSERPFHSVKKVLMKMGAPYDKMQVASFRTTSKGYMGESGIRGGYIEVLNMCPEVRAVYLKSVAAVLCPSVLGQLLLDCLVAPPTDGEDSYPLWKREHDAILDSVKERVSFMANTFNNIEGLSCCSPEGAMYVFPKLHLPEKAIRKARKIGVAPDVFYASELLNHTGIIMTPGSGFGMPDGTWRIRTTVLPKMSELKIMLGEFEKFHIKFLNEYGIPFETNSQVLTL